MRTSSVQLWIRDRSVAFGRPFCCHPRVKSHLADSDMDMDFGDAEELDMTANPLFEILNSGGVGAEIADDNVQGNEDHMANQAADEGEDGGSQSEFVGDEYEDLKRITSNGQSSTSPCHAKTNIPIHAMHFCYMYWKRSDWSHVSV